METRFFYTIEMMLALVFLLCGIWQNLKIFFQREIESFFWKIYLVLIILFVFIYTDIAIEIYSGNYINPQIIHLLFLGSIFVALMVRGAVNTLKNFKKQINEYQKIQRDILQISRSASFGKLSQSLAHQLNNPLSVVITNLEIMEEVGNIDKDIFKRIFSELDRMTVCLKALARYDALSESEITDVNISSVFKDVLILYEGIINSKNLSIQTVIDDNISISKNRAKLESVFLNLFSLVLRENNDVCDEAVRTIAIKCYRDSSGVIIEFIINLKSITKNDSKKNNEISPDKFFANFRLEQFLIKSGVESEGGSLDIELHQGGEALYKIVFPV